MLYTNRPTKKANKPRQHGSTSTRRTSINHLRRFDIQTAEFFQPLERNRVIRVVQELFVQLVDMRLQARRIDRTSMRGTHGRTNTQTAYDQHLEILHTL